MATIINEKSNEGEMGSVVGIIVTVIVLAFIVGFFLIFAWPFIRENDTSTRDTSTSQTNEAKVINTKTTVENISAEKN